MVEQIDVKKGLWLLPSRRRPLEVERCLTAAMDAGLSTPGLVLVQEEDFEELREQYLSIPLPEGWAFYTTKSNGLAAKCQEVYTALSVDADHVFSIEQFDWLGLLADDNTPVTPGFDILLGNQTNGWNIVSSDDAWQAPARIHGATVWSIPLLKAVGYFSPPGLIHRYFDDVWE